ncbi:MAG: S41 family peptidase [Chromatiaceae bacterium]|nr:S41 family peptidase [Gammaproteobacteria bacterium]MCP5305036.1 S41 family peptidase [Chromatiaceae bacterium]MCP5314995.1 S41 family peptidase [Chromatiaceae bacterium]
MKHSLAAVSAAICLVVCSAQLRAEAAEAAEKEASSGLPLDELRVFAEVFGRIKNDYVEPVDDRKLLKYAIEGMLSGLDPHSAYLDEEDYRDIRVGTSGEFGGLGIEVGMENGFVKVIAPIDDTPAQRAGVRSGDLIIRLDDQPVKGMTLDDAVKRMRGKAGTKIRLTIVREGEDKPIEITVVRDVIKTVSVKNRMLEPGFGYVRISQFQARTPEDMLTAIGALKRNAGGNLKGLVLDLRNNPGGILNAAVAISDAFLPAGTIVYTEGRVRDSQLKFRAAPDDVLDGAPIVVLVNGGSASASEIVAGALQDHKRAVIMGQQTFGKGSVQTIVPVNERTAVKLTTARYFTPNGRSIQAEGIVPDITLENVRLTKGEERTMIKEADLARHLVNPGENGNGQDNGKSDKKAAADKDGEDATDYALTEALNLLKGLVILRPDGSA